jgi:SAM-dependent methyltransferase
VTTTPQQALAAVYEGAAAYEKYWAPVLHRHALDLINTVTSAAAPAPPTVVDVATGAGTPVPAVRGLAGSGGRVIALDRSHGMLRRIPRSVLRVQADAAALPLRAASADVLVLAFVLFLLPDARLAVAEAARVLRPGGWLLTATWGTQLNTGADIVIREELDAVGAPTFPVLERSDSLTNTPDRMAVLLSGGDINTSSRPLAATLDARAALALKTGCGILGWRYRRLNAASQEAVHRRATERLTALPPEAFIDRYCSPPLDGHDDCLRPTQQTRLEETNHGQRRGHRPDAQSVGTVRATLRPRHELLRSFAAR